MSWKIALSPTTLNTIFSGDPLGLQPFIDAIDSLVELDEANAFTAILKRCILMKLSGIGRDCIPKDEKGGLTTNESGIERCD